VNLFNALNGNEAKQAILNEVKRALDQDSEFRAHLTFPRVSWHWRLEMNIYPRTPPEKIVESKGELVQMQSTSDPANPDKFVMARDAEGNLMPVVDAQETHVKEVLHGDREIQAPDQTREQERIAQQQAAPGGIRFARHVETGKGAENPVYSPGLNRGGNIVGG
jgi:hypothetical protein